MNATACSVAAWASNRLDVFGLDTNNSMIHKAWDGSSWQPADGAWEPQGNAFNSSPAVVAWGPNRLDIFALDTNNAMRHKAWDGTAWAPDWDNLAGGFNGAPSVVSWGPGRLDIVALGQDNRLYHKAWANNAWLPSQTTWEQLPGGPFNSLPVLTTWGENRLDVFALDVNYQMLHLPYQGSWAATWEPLGGTFNSNPAAVCWGPYRIDVFALGTDNSMYHKAWEGGAWLNFDWEALGGVFNSPPAVASWAANRLDLIALGTDNAMYHRAWDGSSWQPANNAWEPQGGAFNSAPAIVAWGPNRLDLFGLGTDNSMYHKAWNGAIWQADWDGLGGTLDIPAPAPPAAQPSTGLAGNSNYILASNGKNLIDASIEINITEDIVCQSTNFGDLGFMFQFNTYNPPGFACAYQQYMLLLDGPNLYAVIDWWDANLNKLLGWSQFLYTFPTAALPAGYRLEVFLWTDANENVFTPRFSLYLGEGTPPVATCSPDLISLPWTPPVATTGLAPITAFEVNLVGSGNGNTVVLSSGAGTIEYVTWGGPYTALATVPSWTQGSDGTEEQANSTYSTLPAFQEDQPLFQTFRVVPA